MESKGKIQSELRLVLLVALIMNSLPTMSQRDWHYMMIPDSTMKYETMEEILELPYFENKVVLVDLWFTSCKPCLIEFKQMEELKARFKDDSIAYLYLCAPTTVEWDPTDEGSWRRLIKKYDLRGVHVKLTNEFMENFWNSYKEANPEGNLYYFPTYLLIDKNGKITNYNAPRPSSGQALLDKLEKLLQN